MDIWVVWLISIVWNRFQTPYDLACSPNIGEGDQGAILPRVYELVTQIFYYICCIQMANDKHILSQFCTCHDSLAVVACAKLWHDSIIGIQIMIELILQDNRYEVIKPLWSGTLKYSSKACHCIDGPWGCLVGYGGCSMENIEISLKSLMWITVELYFSGFVQDCGIISMNAQEISQPCTKP